MIVNWLCSKVEIEVVGISGGEPFVERRGLMLVSSRLTDAGKKQVIFTSGVWAKSTTPCWIRDVLARCSCVYLSTDVFHSPSVGDARLIQAMDAVAAAGTWIVCQVLDHDGAVERAERLLRVAFGEQWAAHAELNCIVPLTNGRGANIFTRNTSLPGHAFGPCSLVASPMVRYDGLVTGCCNESVIMNLGPSRLRKRANSECDLSTAVQEFNADPLLEVIREAGLGALTKHPRFADLADERFTTNCELCWKMLYRLPEEARSDRLINVMAAIKR
jgi:hypothetical protein